ncbi:MAG TPA: carboxymuconolactone decarboxylase family protein [Solirubrobacteraceae bacterium]|jgi:alkylhydroperoxidase family enzyme
MPRIDPVDPDSAPEIVKRAHAANALDLFGIVAHAESAFEPWLRYSSTLLRKLELDPLLRELAILQVAHLSRSEYEWTQHVAITLAVGGTQAQIDAIERDADVDAEAEAEGSFDERQRQVLVLTREVMLDGVGGERTVAAVVSSLGERQLVELLLVIGNYMGLARLIATTGLEAQAPVVELPPAS